MRHTRELAITLGVVLLLFLCFLPAVIGCDAFSTFGLPEVLGAVVLACLVVAGAAFRPLGSAWLGSLLGAGLYLLPGVLLVSLLGGLEASGGARVLLWWPSFPVGMLQCVE